MSGVENKVTLRANVIAAHLAKKISVTEPEGSLPC
jgi:hypothetical protein